MRIIQPLFALCFTATIAVWLVGGGVAFREMTRFDNTRHMTKLADQLIGRAERSLDYVVIAQTELLIGGHAGCSDAAVNALQKTVLATATVSEIYMFTPSASCAAFDEVIAPRPTKAARDAWPTGRNAAFRVGALKDAEPPMVGVSWRQSEALEIVMALSSQALLFDLLPPDLRDGAHVRLLLIEGAETSPLSASAPKPLGSPRIFYARSDRYPVKAQIAVDSALLAEWRSDPAFGLQIAWVLLGVFVALAVAEAAHRARDPKVQELRRALRRDELTPHFQPIYDLRTGEMVGCEALARWTKRNGERVSPAEFIPIIENAGLNDELLASMLRQTGVTLGPIIDLRPHGFRIGFNIPPQQFVSETFASRIQALTASSGLDAARITLEITERQGFSDPEAAAAVALSLTDEGFRVAIDDVGTGHNGLASIQQLRAGCIKIDKFFVDSILVDARARTMVDMLVAVARQYGMTTVAEGVESFEQAHALRAAGVEAAQGFALAPALSPEKLVRQLHHRAPLPPADETLAATA